MRHMLSLKYVDAVARSGSIRSAAEKLAITPSALTRRISALEDELGVEIFERKASGVNLNSAGEILIQHVRAQMADMERVKSRIADLSGLRLGHVRIVATPETLGNLLPRAIARYRSQFPHVTFEVNPIQRDQVEDSLISHEADILFAFQPQNIPNVQILLPALQPVHAIVSRNHPLTQKRQVKLVDCLEHDLLLPNRGDGIRELLESAAARKGLKLSPAVQSADPVLLEGLAEEGGGVGFAIPIAMTNFQARSSLCAIPLKQGETEQGFLVVGQLRNRTLPVAAAKFVEDIRKVIASEDGLSEPAEATNTLSQTRETPC